MRNILFLISLSQHKLFSDEYKLLYSEYDKTIKKYNLPIKIIGYLGGYDQCFVDHANHILYLDADDKNIVAKYQAAHLYIMQYPWIVDNYQYDVVMATNTSTVVNLQLLNKMIQDSRFDMSGIYGNQIRVRNSKLSFDFPEGKLMVYSKDVRDKIIRVWERFSVQIDNRTEAEKQYMWTTAEDQHIGKCCQYLNIPIHDIPTPLKFHLTSFGSYNDILNSQFLNLDTLDDIDELSNTLIMVLKTAEYNFKSSEYNKCVDAIRNSTECWFIKLSHLIYSHTFTDEEVKIFLSRIYQ